MAGPARGARIKAATAPAVVLILRQQATTQASGPIARLVVQGCGQSREAPVGGVQLNLGASFPKSPICDGDCMSNDADRSVVLARTINGADHRIKAIDQGRGELFLRGGSRSSRSRRCPSRA